MIVKYSIHISCYVYHAEAKWLSLMFFQTFGQTRTWKNWSVKVQQQSIGIMFTITVFKYWLFYLFSSQTHFNYILFFSSNIELPSVCRRRLQISTAKLLNLLFNRFKTEEFVKSLLVIPILVEVFIFWSLGFHCACTRLCCADVDKSSKTQSTWHG